MAQRPREARNLLCGMLAGRARQSPGEEGSLGKGLAVRKSKCFQPSQQ